MERKTEVFGFNLLLTLACLITGLLAGAAVDRYVVQVPAWRHLGVSTWATYTMYAQFGNGLYLYPFEVLGSFILLFTASAIVLMHKDRFKSIALAVHLATIFTTFGLIFTFFTFPVMLSVQSMGNDPVRLQQAFDKFHFWGLLRGISQCISFFFCIWVFTRNYKLDSI